MASKKNPFPGMNPYLERRWPDVHTSLIGYIKDAIATNLPDGLVARAEESIAVDALIEIPRYRADVHVEESWKQGVPPAWNPAAATESGVVAAEPDIILVEPLTERWVQISTPDGLIVTLIEILSPTNKTGEGRDRYLKKQSDYLSSNANLVEIDLIRSGQRVISVPSFAFDRKGPDPYHVCVARPHEPGRRELYRIPLRQRLPAIRIPLRRTDADIVVDLQPLLDRCYEMGGYWQSDYSEDPEPPLAEEDRVWVDERLREAGLR